MTARKQNLYVAHSTHLDLYWIGTQPECLEIGAQIIDDAVRLAVQHAGFTFLLDTVRFLEYYLAKHPDNTSVVKKLFDEGRFEIAACYTDRLENSHDGESLVRNVQYGKKVLNRLIGLNTELAYHPDLPGLAEQSPQIYKKSGVRYYLFARGFARGGRFWWKGLDDSRIVAYNFPVHYSYYNIEKEIIPYLTQTKRSIQAEDVLISCSAGDLGAANTFFSKDADGKWDRVPLMETIEALNVRYPELNVQMSNVKSVLDRMDTRNLEVRSGEYPSKWGTFGGSANNVRIAQMDAQASALLLEAEKYSTICDLLGIAVERGAAPVNPLKHRGGSGGSRNYFELRQHPTCLEEWFDFAWRLQLVTQDHNYGGIGGMQSNFDRFLYKSCAIRIAEDIRNQCLNRLVSHIRPQSGQASVVVFNSLNWERTEHVCIGGDCLDERKTYVAADSSGNRSPVIRTPEGYTFAASAVPSLGYKTFSIEEADKIPEAVPDKRTMMNKDRIIIVNPFYEVVIDRNSGSLIYVKDVQLNRTVIENPDFLSVDLFADRSFSVSEKVHDKQPLESSKHHVRSVEITEDHAYWTKVETVTEIGHSKLVMQIYVDHCKKEIRVIPTLFWIGEKEVQLNMNLGFVSEFARVHYAVPYGVQQMGRFLDEERPWAGDEISPELYERYREAIGWMVLESADAGICVSSSQTSFDFDRGGLRAMLLRVVRSGGDQDVIFRNEGKLSWEFRITSYCGDWQRERAYRTGWERQYPLCPILNNGAGEPVAPKLVLPPSCSWLDTGGEGVVTVLKKSEADSEACILRAFNSTSGAAEFAVATSLPVQDMESCDLNETVCGDELNRLDPYEIKTIRMNIRRDGV
ncbi:glycoside hydrolase family 38 C-terminal domain-containing protein [Paenibacillus piri]|uniref:Glycoside hydrolase family 38 N-terminal domain-containing protein n=1 Tax=Paenibacillus piri TaxID=2547395 RepID=A0A4R5KZI4_9BACL|nr:glycosyl hydrolase-related protein [Paenibacillus piri]TDG00709.1 hypothetical protein E1757_03540 [Paenibacillus piri]